MHFICTPMWTKFYSYKKWVLHAATDQNRHGYYRGGNGDGDVIWSIVTACFNLL
jgi:hypothetical protein